MIPKEVILGLGIVLKQNILEFKNIKTKEDEMNIDVHLKQKTLKIIKNNLENINKSLPSFINVLDIQYNSTYFSKKKNEKSNVSKLADLIIILIVNGEELHYEIELKKTNKNVIPGSSINQINPYKTVIFFQFKKEISVEVGYYAQAVSGNIRFPDRMPRPEVSFEILKQNNANNDIEKIIKENKDIFENPVEVFLPDRWLVDILDNIKKNNWFSRAIRYFSYSLLIKYDTMSEEEKKELLKKLKE